MSNKPITSSAVLHCTCQAPDCRHRAEFHAKTLDGARALADAAGWSWPHRLCPDCRHKPLVVKIEEPGK